MSIFGKIFGDANEKVINEMRPVAEEINNLEKDFEKLSDGELKKKTEEFKAQIANGKSLDELLPEAFAAVREAAKRTLGQRHFDVQLMGGIALHRGEIAEMKTGEGKTLVATLPAYLNALTGKGVHIVTVNDYLSRRDAAWMGQIYDALGLSVGVLNHEASYLYDTNLAVAPPSSGLTAEDQIRDALGAFKIVHEFLRPCSRREAYTADIIYGTNNEYGFDYLRDNMVYSAQQMSQREHHFAIVDEVDSILIDEARTPLIISMPDAESAELYKVFSKIAPRLKENVDYNIDEKMKTALISEPGIEKVEQMLGVKDIYTERGMRFVHHLEQALRAQALFVRDRDYVVKSAAHGGGEVIIVDEFTGRLMPGRRWSDGLHQAIEAKEGVNVQQESRTLATITFQNYFRMYEKLAGMTGTAQTSAEEFHKVYKLEVVQIPTNKQMIRKDLQDKVFQTEKGKFQALVREIKERSQKGQPVLVGTVSIEKNEKLAAMLQREGIAHKILNAKNHEEEGAIIAQAGRFGAVTVATNMAGRGVDIILGGNPPSADEASRVREVGGLLVVGTERHEARRIDDQLRGRSGRQGDPGESHFLRKHVLEYDDVMNKQRTAIYARRKKILFAESKEIEDEALKLLEDVLSKIVTAHTAGPENEWNRKEIFENLVSLVGGDGDSTSLRERVEKTESREGLTELAKNYAKDAFAKKKEGIAARLPDWQGFAGALRMVMLQAIDALWMEHLEAMEYMRSSVRLRAYGQKDPLVEYKNEGAKMFQQLEGHINTYIANLIFKITPATQPHNVSRQPNVKHPMSDKNSFGRHAERGNGQAQLGRNDPCPCGSGKKYKRCHGQ
ncbi:MAG: Protein translocase subunit SecA [Parcubacteria group bacterium GW2011_GWC1_44_10]|nr:MAG: Protein translocase subunit SecA [Parcubacteria group bacterium GW2011_GWC1_44_10]